MGLALPSVSRLRVGDLSSFHCLSVLRPALGMGIGLEVDLEASLSGSLGSISAQLRGKSWLGSEKKKLKALWPPRRPLRLSPWPLRIPCGVWDYRNVLPGTERAQDNQESPSASASTTSAGAAKLTFPLGRTCTRDEQHRAPTGFSELPAESLSFAVLGFCILNPRSFTSGDTKSKQNTTKQSSPILAGPYVLITVSLFFSNFLKGLDAQKTEKIKKQRLRKHNWG